MLNKIFDVLMPAALFGSLLAVVLLVCQMGLKDLEIAKANYAAENACVATLISQEVERINIATKDGKCWEEENGYYK